MKLLLSILTLTLLACTTASGQGELRRQTVQHDGVERHYSVYVPSTYTPTMATPLVVNMHGLNGNAEQQINGSAMNSVAEANEFLVVYPNATNSDWSQSPDHNVSFVAETLLDALKNDFAIDDSRVYATGMSQGGIMSYLLGVSHPDRFAAIAPVGGTRAFFSGGSGLFPTFVERVPERPLPLLHIHGTADVVIPYEEGGTVLEGLDDVVFPGVMDTVLAEWASNNGCAPNVTAFDDLPNVFADDLSTVSTFSFADCDTYTSASGMEVVADVTHIRINGGGHSWPVAESDRDAAIKSFIDRIGEEALPVFVPLNSDISASVEIWNFFERHQAAAVVPEPSGQIAMLLGCLGMLCQARDSRRRKTKRSRTKNHQD